MFSPGHNSELSGTVIMGPILNVSRLKRGKASDPEFKSFSWGLSPGGKIILYARRTDDYGALTDIE